jgi:hypothetical protein
MSDRVYRNFSDAIESLFIKGTSYDENLVVGGNLTVDSDTLTVNSITNRVGIDNINPQYPLDVVGDMNTTTGIRINGSNALTSTSLGSGILSSSLTSLGTQTSSLNLGGNNITNVGTVAGTLTTANQPNVTRLGTQTADLNMGGFDISNVGSIAGTMTTPAQSLITSLGNLSGLTVDGIARLNDSLYLGAYVTNVMNKGIFFRASSGSVYQENGASALSLSITTWDQSTANVTPDSMSFNAFDGFRWVTNSSGTPTTIPMSITGAGVTTISTLTVTNAITNKQTPKAFINFNGSSSTINNSFNVSSITRNSTGVYTITFTTAMSDTSYAWFGSTGFNSTAQSNFVSSPGNTPMSTWKTTTTLRVQTYYANDMTNLNPHDINVIIFN